MNKIKTTTDNNNNKMRIASVIEAIRAASAPNLPLDQVLEAFASRGVPIFPCRAAASGGRKAKSPLTPHGFKDASCDIETLRSWWRTNPGALIGLPTGDGLTVVDIDVKKGDGHASALSLGLPATFTVRTMTPAPDDPGVFGEHRYYSDTGDTGCTTDLVPFVDVRGRGGYVIAPPGGGYRVVNETCGAVPLPDSISGAMLRGRGKEMVHQIKKGTSVSQGAFAGGDPGEAAMLYLLGGIIRDIDCDCSYDRWCRTGMAIHSECPGEGGFNLWDQWSSSGSKYMGSADLWKHWCSFDTAKGGPLVGVGTLKAYAREDSMAASPDTGEGAGLQAVLTQARAGVPYARTDLGNAERLIAQHGDSVRWDVSRSVWRTWDGRRWATDTTLRVLGLAARTVRSIRDEASVAPKGEGKRDLGLELFAHAIKSESRDRQAAMVEVSKAQPGVAVAADALDTDPWVLNVLNGTLDLRTGKLRPHRREDLLTKLVPVNYHEGLRDARLDAFLHDATGGDTDVITFLQTVAGYTLTGDTREEKLFLIYGPTASGKSTFLDMLGAALGEYGRTVSSDLLTKKRNASSAGAATPELAGLAGTRMASSSELEKGKEMAEALAKNLTGGENITARHLYSGLFDFRPQFKLWLALNHCPRVSADDGAIWRRILRIGFDHTIPSERRDKTLKPYLRDPDGGAPAVLAWAVEGCLRWQREGLRVPAAVVRSTEGYRGESDTLAPFLEDCVAFTPDAWVSWSSLWSAYLVHATEEGLADRFRVSPRRLRERLKTEGCTAEKRKGFRGWCGVELVDPPFSIPSLRPRSTQGGW